MEEGSGDEGRGMEEGSGDDEGRKHKERSSLTNQCQAKKVLVKIHVAIFPLFSSDLRATMTESFVPGTNLNEEKPRYLLRG